MSITAVETCVHGCHVNDSYMAARIFVIHVQTICIF
jgi:hypothetical protein